MKAIFLFISILFLGIQCKSKTPLLLKKPVQLDIQGHRGCRGLMPENTIPAMLHALDLGVHTLEMDVVVSKDNKIVVSHEPYLNSDFCSDKDGTRIKKSKDFNLYAMTLAEIQEHDCGTLEHEKYPEQKSIATVKPALSELIEAVESYVASNGLESPNYNIEIKRVKEEDGVFHPEFKLFTDLTLETIEQGGIKDRATVQCFDLEVLQYMQERYPDWKQVYLISNMKSAKKNIEKLGHVPYVYSPHYKLVNQNLVAYCKEQGMQLIPWTVNEVEDMKEMISLGVDGIISDYPNRLITLFEGL